MSDRIDFVHVWMYFVWVIDLSGRIEKKNVSLSLSYVSSQKIKMHCLSLSILRLITKNKDAKSLSLSYVSSLERKNKGDAVTRLHWADKSEASMGRIDFVHVWMRGAMDVFYV